MKHKVGDIVLINKEWFQCVEGRCKDCYFSEKRYLCKQFITKDFCTSGIVFKKLEKVGEPFERNGYLYQEYKAHTYPLLMNCEAKLPTANGFAVKIKQTKEDMEEKKQKLDDLVGLYSSAKITYKEFDKELKALYTKQAEEDKPVLKPFNLEEAKSGKPVCTRDGRKARIICFDKKCLDEQILIVLVDCGKEESIYFYTTDGKCIDDFSNFDLMMLPEKKEGWVNVYKGDDKRAAIVSNAYVTKEKALNKIDEVLEATYITTKRIEWEE